jgi:hypothetical protein
MHFESLSLLWVSRFRKGLVYAAELFALSDRPTIGVPRLGREAELFGIERG